MLDRLWNYTCQWVVVVFLLATNSVNDQCWTIRAASHWKWVVCFESACLHKQYAQQPHAVIFFSGVTTCSRNLLRWEYCLCKQADSNKPLTFSDYRASVIISKKFAMWKCNCLLECFTNKSFFPLQYSEVAVGIEHLVWAQSSLSFVNHNMSATLASVLKLSNVRFIPCTMSSLLRNCIKVCKETPKTCQVLCIAILKHTYPNSFYFLLQCDVS